MLWEAPELWPGRTVYILGGGPSLQDVDVERLREQRVIAVNNAYKIAPWADVVYFQDCSWYSWHYKSLDDFPGLKVTTCIKTKDDPRVLTLRRGHRSRLDDRPGFLFRGNNSGFGAITLAIKFGAKKIILFGYDMKMVNGNHNWHTEHIRKVPNKVYQDQFLRFYELLSMQLPETDVEVINATPGSALGYFPIVTPEEVYP